jgi:hypothetical protein
MITVMNPIFFETLTLPAHFTSTERTAGMYYYSNEVREWLKNFTTALTEWSEFGAWVVPKLQTMHYTKQEKFTFDIWSPKMKRES